MEIQENVTNITKEIITCKCLTLESKFSTVNHTFKIAFGVRITLAGFMIMVLMKNMFFYVFIKAN